jgi:hypothetical protein
MLTQAEANALIAMQKNFSSPAMISLPAGSDQTHELVGSDERERFLLDLYRGTIRLSKVKFQTRGRSVIVLVRLDLDGSPHTNPDGSHVGRTHLHLYREGFDDKWAYTIDPNFFSSPQDVEGTFKRFCEYCNIIGVPNFQEGLL